MGSGLTWAYSMMKLRATGAVELFVSPSGAWRGAKVFAPPRAGSARRPAMLSRCILAAEETKIWRVA